MTEPAPVPGPGRSPGPSFRAIFEAELTYVWNALRKLGVHPSDLEDVAHEVFVVVHRHLGDYDPTRPLRPWLFGICVRVASDYRRLARHRREVAPGPVEPSDPAPAADEHLERRQAQQLVSEALDASTSTAAPSSSCTTSRRRRCLSSPRPSRSP